MVRGDSTAARARRKSATKSVRHAGSVQEIVALARLYASEGEVRELVGWLALRKGRAQALAGDRPEIERLEREGLARWMLAQAAKGESLVPERRRRRPGSV